MLIILRFRDQGWQLLGTRSVPRDLSVHPQIFVEASPIAIVGYFLVAGLIAVNHARNKRFAEHR